MLLIPWPSDRAKFIWPRVEPLLLKAISFNNGYLPADILEAITDQRMQLFVIADNDNSITGAIVTEIHQFPRIKSLFILFIGGRRLKDWPMDALWKWAEFMGCQEALAIGRDGLSKFFSSGKTKFRYYMKPLGGDHNVRL